MWKRIETVDLNVNADAKIVLKDFSSYLPVQTRAGARAPH